MEDDKFFDVAMIGLWKLSNESNIEDQYAGNIKIIQVPEKSFRQVKKHIYKIFIRAL